jgi:hypothetical protein
MSKKPTRISTDTLEKLRARLKALPPKPKADHSRQDTVRELQAEIRHAVSELGYSFTDIAAFYEELGAEVSPSSIASMLRELAPKAPSKKAAAKPRKATVREKDTLVVPPQQTVFAVPQDLAPYEVLPDEDEELFEHIINASLHPDLR